MNEAFRQLFDEVRSGIIWVSRQGVVRYANKSAVQLTACMLGQPLMDPVAERVVREAGQGLLTLPHRFELRNQEAYADVVRAAVMPAPVGNDLMLVLNNVSEERWYHHALGNLVRFLQAEMGTPLAKLSRELLLLSKFGEDIVKRPVDQLPQPSKVAADARMMSAKLSTLNELIDVFGASAIRADDRIVLSELVVEATKASAKVLGDRNVAVVPEGLDADVSIYGSRHWLLRALSEFIQHCGRTVQPGSRIMLSLQATGTRVLLRSSNAGLFLSAHQRRASQTPFAVGDDLKAAQPRIGLALARFVIEQHGGLIRIDDVDGGVDFVIELPAGAPAGAQKDDVDAGHAVEQAQRYAHDMARLMARRTPPAAALKSDAGTPKNPL